MMITSCHGHRLYLQTTTRFSVLTSDYKEGEAGDSPSSKPKEQQQRQHGLPVMELSTLLLHRHFNTTKQVSNELWHNLRHRGFVVLSSKSNSEPNRIIRDFRRCLGRDFFPSDAAPGTGDGTKTGGAGTGCDIPKRRKRNAGNLRGGITYISERGVPMWKLGYEECDDIREAYRVHGGSPDSQPWPCTTNVDTVSPTYLTPRQKWLRAMALCRHICDEALYLTLGYDTRRRWAGSGPWSWKSPPLRQNGENNATSRERKKVPYYQMPEGSIPHRDGDYSVMYAMHYFNDDTSEMARQANGKVTGTTDTNINVKEHVDPSLFVLEPFLADVEGLQVLPRPGKKTSSVTTGGGANDDADGVENRDWISCDGPNSPIHQVVPPEEGRQAMVLFVGRAFANKAKELCGRDVTPTLHRVVAPGWQSGSSALLGHEAESRRTVIYEQKYEEYFPPPALD